MCFDIHNRDVLLKGLHPYYVVEKNGDLMIDRNSFDSSNGRLYNQRIVIRNGERKDMPYSIRLYNPSEIKILLDQADLRFDRFFGGWDEQPLSSNSSGKIVIARKPNGEKR